MTCDTICMVYTLAFQFPEVLQKAKCIRTVRTLITDLGVMGDLQGRGGNHIKWEQALESLCGLHSR